MGDMLSNKDVAQLPEQMKRGVKIHRAIDHHTDNHASMRQVVKLLRPRHRKYAPVVADILLDHVLVINWKVHSSVDYETFENWVYNTISTNFDSIPFHLHKRLKSMVLHRWLHQYSSLDGMQYVLDRMDKRARFQSDFGSAIQDYHKHQVEMSDALSVLFQDLTKLVRKMY